jgi:hypothetical protein
MTSSPGSRPSAPAGSPPPAQPALPSSREREQVVPDQPLAAGPRHSPSSPTPCPAGDRHQHHESPNPQPGWSAPPQPPSPEIRRNRTIVYTVLGAIAGLAIVVGVGDLADITLHTLPARVTGMPTVTAALPASAPSEVTAPPETTLASHDQPVVGTVSATPSRSPRAADRAHHGQGSRSQAGTAERK